MPDEEKIARHYALGMYKGERCRICGEVQDNPKESVWAGYSNDNSTRTAHKVCWDKNIPKKNWKIQ